MSGVCFPLWECLRKQKIHKQNSTSRTIASRTVPTGTVMERTRVRGKAVGENGQNVMKSGESTSDFASSRRTSD